MSSYLQFLAFRPLLLTVSQILALSSLCNIGRHHQRTISSFAPPSRSGVRAVTILKSAEAGVFLLHYVCTFFLRSTCSQTSSESPLGVAPALRSPQSSFFVILGFCGLLD